MYSLLVNMKSSSRFIIVATKFTMKICSTSWMSSLIKYIILHKMFILFSSFFKMFSLLTVLWNSREDVVLQVKVQRVQANTLVFFLANKFFLLFIIRSNNPVPVVFILKGRPRLKVKVGLSSILWDLYSWVASPPGVAKRQTHWLHWYIFLAEWEAYTKIDPNKLILIKL